jgi:integrase
VAKSILVSGPIEPGLRRGENFTIFQIHFDRSKGRAPPIGDEQQPDTRRLEVVWNRLKHQGVSENVWNIIRNGSRKTTDKVYQSAWRIWVRWCHQRGANPVRSDIAVILNFLADLFESGRSYSSINVHRSMLSSTLDPVGGIPVGQHQVVVKLLQSIYYLKPPKPKYANTWDVNLVLSFLASLGPNEELDLKTISHKLTILLALSTFLRVGELANIERNSIHFSETEASFSLSKPRKSQKTGPVANFTLKRLPNSQLCPVDCLGYYIFMTDVLRTSSSSKLLVSFIKPHRPVTATTISIWIKSVLSGAGIDKSFTAHSTRGAASSKAAAAGIPIDEILKRASWTKESTFLRFYKRTVTSSSCDSVVLGRRFLVFSPGFEITLKVERRVFAYNCWLS